MEGPPAQHKPLWLARRIPCFYGYVVLAAATCGKIMSAPGQSPCIGTQIDAIMASLGLSRTQISALYLVATLGSALLQPKAREDEMRSDQNPRPRV